MPNVSLSHVLLAFPAFGIVLLFVLLVFVVLDLIWTLGNEVISATTIVACPLFLVWKVSLQYLVALLLYPIVKPLYKESNIINLLILIIIIFTLT